MTGAPPPTPGISAIAHRRWCNWYGIVVFPSYGAVFLPDKWPVIIGAPLFTLAIVLAVMMIRNGARLRAHTLFHKGDVCAGCNYQLSGGVGAQCPECGRVQTEEDRLLLARTAGGQKAPWELISK